MSPLCRLTLSILLFHAGFAGATTYTWPGPAPCSSTLQACVDATANGDRIEVASATIDEDISIYDKDRTLASAPGFDPAFGAGHWLSITSSALSGNRTVAVSGFSFTDGYVFANYRGSGTANYDLRDLTLTRASGNVNNAITVQAESGIVNATVYDNRLIGTRVALGNGAIALLARGGTLNANAYYNHVRAGSADSGSDAGSGIYADYSGAGSGGTLKLHGNEVRGNFGRGGLFIAEGSLAGAAAANFEARLFNNVVVGNGADFGTGVFFIVNDGSIHAVVAANTVTRVGYGMFASHWAGGGASASISGVVSSNLVKANVAALSLDAAVSSLTNDYNLINAPTSTVAYGAHTITTAARLVSDVEPRLGANSPAIDAADTTTVGLGMLLAGVPYSDADGLRRMKTWFSPNKIDIGAYEYGDASFAHVATTANTSGHVTYMHDPTIDGVATAHLQVTQNYSLRELVFNQPLGTWLAGATWTVFTEDIVSIPAGLGFNVFSPAPGDGAFRHAANVSNTAGWQTRLDDASVNNLPDRLLFVTQDFGGTYNAHDIGVRYVATSASAGDWYVVNLDRTAGGPVPVGAGISVYAQAASPNAFRVTKVAGIGGAHDVPLDHPLLNGTMCAQPIVTRVDSGTVVASGHFDVYYNDGSQRWNIYAYDNSGLVAGTQFNVLVNPAQVADCRDRIFANGFD